MVNQSGQVAVEYILVAIVILAFSLTIAKGISSNDLLANLNPWLSIQGMVESGVWDQPARARNLHPNYLERSVSFKGDNE
jgi:hypothetical protein